MPIQSAHLPFIGVLPFPIDLKKHSLDLNLLLYVPFFWARFLMGQLDVDFT
jgi:hypothetical protein